MGSRVCRLVFDPEKCVCIASDKYCVESLDKRWFGRREGDKLVLSLVETAYLLFKKQVVVEHNGVVYSDLDGLLSRYHSCFKTMFWPYLTVYNDLRSRGRRTRDLGNGRFLVKHKDGSLRLLAVLEEKRLVKASEIVELLETARRNNLVLVLAIVSLQGDLTYYEAIKIDLKK